MLRPLGGELSSDLPGRTLEEVQRLGKFLLLRFSDDRVMAINPMLTGAIQYYSPKARAFKRTCIVLSLSNGWDLRYLDERQMGMVYYVRSDQLHQVPRLNEQGPDVLDELSFDEFKQRLRAFHGEIKGILTRGRVLSGIGNAYADEVLFAAQVYPFRRRKALADHELRRIYEQSRRVVEEAIPILRERMGQDIHLKIRDFLKVHNKGGTPLPQMRKLHQPGERQPAHHQLLPQVPARHAYPGTGRATYRPPRIAHESSPRLHPIPKTGLRV